jgi:putative phosphoesterase
MTRRRATVVGVIADTHGLLRPEALAALRGSDLIVHAGDVGAPEVLAGLRTVAPVTAVRGNNDRGEWARTLSESEAVEVAGRWLYVLHDVHALDLDPAAAGFAAVIAGHSHRPLVEERRGVLFVNPGSAGPRRFTLPVAVARLRVSAKGVCAETVVLSPRSPPDTAVVKCRLTIPRGVG